MIVFLDSSESKTQITKSDSTDLSQVNLKKNTTQKKVAMVSQKNVGDTREVLGKSRAFSSFYRLPEFITFRESVKPLEKKIFFDGLDKETNLQFQDFLSECSNFGIQWRGGSHDDKIRQELQQKIQGLNVDCLEMVLIPCVNSFLESLFELFTTASQDNLRNFTLKCIEKGLRTKFKRKQKCKLTEQNEKTLNKLYAYVNKFGNDVLKFVFEELSVNLKQQVPIFRGVSFSSESELYGYVKKLSMGMECIQSFSSDVEVALSFSQKYLHVDRSGYERRMENCGLPISDRPKNTGLIVLEGFENIDVSRLGLPEEKECWQMSPLGSFEKLTGNEILEKIAESSLFEPKAKDYISKILKDTEQTFTMFWFRNDTEENRACAGEHAEARQSVIKPAAKEVKEMQAVYSDDDDEKQAEFVEEEEETVLQKLEEKESEVAILKNESIYSVKYGAKNEPMDEKDQVKLVKKVTAEHTLTKKILDDQLFVTEFVSSWVCFSHKKFDDSALKYFATLLQKYLGITEYETNEINKEKCQQLKDRFPELDVSVIEKVIIPGINLFHGENKKFIQWINEFEFEEILTQIYCNNKWDKSKICTPNFRKEIRELLYGLRDFASPSVEYIHDLATSFHDVRLEIYGGFQFEDREHLETTVKSWKSCKKMKVQKFHSVPHKAIQDLLISTDEREDKLRSDLNLQNSYSTNHKLLVIAQNVVSLDMGKLLNDTEHMEV